MGSINRAIEEGRIDSSEATSVFERVEWDTRRHISKLEDLQGEAPEQAQPGIERSLMESARGSQMATQSLQQSLAADVITGRRSPGGSFGGFGTSPGTVSGGSSLGGSSRGRSSGQRGGPRR